jgi:hypothetical protein
VMILVTLEVGVFVVFGRHLVNRLVLWPLERVVAAVAPALAAGTLRSARCLAKIPTLRRHVTPTETPVSERNTLL